ncbi:hypothetical protein NliqN6_4605 [Naganishia liquefaciens]|uniref:Vps72/YL1 C-terminal domain-containing protein n=1 Tax=Naganishia liquefaciens TaxID=104408 RepID=A0A8H3TWM9_9TREE|nr:hypothetical protein NliqN6_4605 [Naganishia liquefaciens]
MDAPFCFRTPRLACYDGHIEDSVGWQPIHARHRPPSTATTMPALKKARKSSAYDDPTGLVSGGPPSENGTPQPTSSATDHLNFANIPLPFKSPAWTHRRATTRPAKRTLKQIQTAERERAGGKVSLMTAPSSEKNSRRGTPSRVIKPVKAATRGKNARFLSKAVKEELAREEAAAAAAAEAAAANAVEEEDEAGEEEREDPLVVKDEQGNLRKREIITWFTPDAHPSLLPTKKYCDITGLPARYTDPKTKLRYHDLEVFNVIRQLGPGQDQQYLMLRGAQQTLM